MPRSRWWVPVTLVLGLVGCLSELPPSTDAELTRALDLPASTPARTVHLLNRQGELRPLPTGLEAASGSLVSFRLVGHQAISVHFDLDETDPPLARWLESRNLVASPPLARAGARFVLHLEGAPAGRALFRLEGQGASGSGVLVVVE